MGLGTVTKVVLGICLGVVVGIILLVTVSLKKLKSDQVGLKYNTILHELKEDPSFEGLHNGPPGFRFVMYSSVFSTLDFESLQCLNKDGVQINLDISYQYRVRPNDLFTIVMQFRDRDTTEQILEAIGHSAIHDACSRFNTSQFQAERGAFQEAVREILVDKYNAVSCDVTDLQVNDIRRPSVYEESVKRKESAREDIKVAQKERPYRLTEAQTTKLKADTQSQITVEKALSEARIALTRSSSAAEGIVNTYTKEAAAYKILKSSEGLGLTNEAFLTYLGVRAIEDAQNTVMVGMDSPAKTAWLTP